MLPAGGSCLLGSINLSEFVTDNKEFDIMSFRNAVRTSVIALNEVLDEGLNLHPLVEQRESVKQWRQIGLGIFGLADMLIKMGILYGNGAIDICDEIGFNMIDEAIYTSAMIAKDNGVYPNYNKDAILTSPFFIENTTDETKKAVYKYGLNNSQLLTIAPTGSLSSMLGVSGGIEPIFANYYTRKTESLHGHDEYYKVYTPIVSKYMKENAITDDENLPLYFVTAQDLNYKERINMQSIWQKHIDASISSTVNVPNDFTIEQTEDLYMSAWHNGLKGVTIYRDNCQRTGVLTTNSATENNTEEQLKRGEIISTDDTIIGLKRKLMTGCGSLHCQAFFEPSNGELREIYLSKGSTGGCNNFMIGLSRMISAAARAGVSLDDIVDQLMSTGSCPSYAKRGKSKGSCCPMAIGFALKDMSKQFKEYLLTTKEKTYITKHEETETTENNTTCPECGAEITFEGGCNICKSCGWSKCD